MIVECPGCQSRYDVTGRAAGTRARCRCGTVFTLPEPPSHAAALSCPQCGAAVAPDAARCAYCSTALAVRACPRCFGMIFLGHKHCPHCGGPLDVPASANPDGKVAPRGCPRCSPRSDLEGQLVGGALLDRCPRCAGVFVDAATLERVLAERRQVPAAESLGRASPPAAGGAFSPQGATYIRCPDCNQLMNRVNFGRVSGVIVDVCRAHGTWFDGDELPRVVAFAADGGLERAERRDIERLREEARAAHAAAAMRMANPRGPTHVHPFEAEGLILLGLLGSFHSDFD